MAISNEQWQQIEMELVNFNGEVELKLGDHSITLCKEFIAENQLAIAVYIDDEINHGVGWPDSRAFEPITAQLWRPRNLVTCKFRGKLIRAYGKQRAKKVYPDLDKKRLRFEPYFPNFAPFRSQYCKLKELEVVSIGFQGSEA